jgi:hypothetical protein
MNTNQLDEEQLYYEKKYLKYKKKYLALKKQLKGGNPFNDPELSNLIGKRIKATGNIVDYLFIIDKYEIVKFLLNHFAKKKDGQELSASS